MDPLIFVCDAACYISLLIRISHQRADTKVPPRWQASNSFLSFFLFHMMNIRSYQANHFRGKIRRFLRPLRQWKAARISRKAPCRRYVQCGMQFQRYIFNKLYCNFSTGDKRRAKVNASPSLIRSGMINGITHQARTIARPTAPFA